MSPTVSVALCTYNGASFLELQLQSLVSQEHVPDELVVSDDASTDATPRILESFAGTAPFTVRYTRNERRLGVVANFERAIRLCRGDLIALCDQDDVWLPQKLATQVDLLARHEDVALIFSDAEIVDDALEPYGYRLWDVLGFNAQEQERMGSPDAVHVLLRHQVVTGATTVFRAGWRDLILPMPSAWVHDGWIGFMVAVAGRVMALAEPLVLYRQHARNEIGARRVRLRQYLARASYERSRETLVGAARRFEEVRLRLAERRCEVRHPRTFQLIDEAVAHLRHRAGLPRSRLRRLGTIARELVTGRYFRYSAGMLSLGQDLWV